LVGHAFSLSAWKDVEVTATDWSTPGAASGVPAGRIVEPSDPTLLTEDDHTAGVARVRGDASLPSNTPEGLGSDQPLADLQPVGVLGVLDGGFAMLRFRFGRLVGLTALVLLPVITGELLVVLRFPQPDAADPLTTPSSLEFFAASSSSTGWGLLFALFGAVSLTWVGIAVGQTARAWADGTDPTWGEMVKAAARRWWVAPVLGLVTVTIKTTASCLFGVGFFLADALLFIAAVVAGGEHLGPFASVGRSVGLTRRVYGRALGICVGGMFITTILQSVVLVGPLLFATSFGVSGTAEKLISQAAGLILLVTTPLTACIAARAWVDFRCRLEGTDLDVRAVACGLA
jgi:hypothetical protein